MSTAATIPETAFVLLGEVQTLVKRFEHGSLTKREWNHRAHLTVAAWYLLHHEECEATNKVVSGILHFNRLNGIERTRTSGYHETLTLFWIAVARRYLSTLSQGLLVLDRVNRFVSSYEDQKRLFLEHYSAERIWSWEARLQWMEPDLKPLSSLESGFPERTSELRAGGRNCNSNVMPTTGLCRVG